MSQRLDNLKSSLKYIRKAKRWGILGLVAISAGMILYLLQGQWQLVIVNTVALLFAIAYYMSNRASEASTQTSIALHHETEQLRSQHNDR